MTTPHGNLYDMSLLTHQCLKSESHLAAPVGSKDKPIIFFIIGLADLNQTIFNTRSVTLLPHERTSSEGSSLKSITSFPCVGYSTEQCDQVDIKLYTHYIKLIHEQFLVQNLSIHGIARVGMNHSSQWTWTS